MPDKLTIRIPYPAKSKPRPRVTRFGTYNDPKYTAWKTEIRAFVESVAKAVHFDGTMRCEMVLHKDHVRLVIERTDADYQFIRGDVDNLAGGLMDALQAQKGSTGLYENDFAIRELSVRIAHKDEK